MISPLNTATFNVKDLGLIEYQEAFALQKQTVLQVINGQNNTLLLCEHPPVLTLGRLADQANILASLTEIRQKGIAIIPVDRGGDITLHAPGQLVIYPIFDLRHFGKDLKRYLSILEQVAIDLLGEFGIVANRISGQRGIWVGQEKIASIGIGVRKWISFHGMAININTDLNLFSLIRPCGLDVRMTSLRQLTKEKQDLPLIKQKVIGILRNLMYA